MMGLHPLRVKRYETHVSSVFAASIAIRNVVQFREGKAPAEPCVSAVQWLGRSLALPS
jgi:hypothetical protein